MNRHRFTGSFTQPMTRYYKNLVYGDYIATDGIVLDNYSEIADEHRDDRHFKNCHHMKIFIDPNMGYLIDGQYWNSPKFALLGAFAWQEPLLDVVQNHVAPSGEELESFNKRAFDAMKPGIELAIDLPTFLAEIKDLPKLFDSQLLKKFGLQDLDTREIISKLKKFKGFISRTVQDTKVLEETFTKSLASDFLAYSFGVAPTIADAKGLWKGVTEIDKKLDQLLRRAGTPCRRHYSERIERPSFAAHVQPDRYSSELFINYEGGKSKLTATSLFTYVLNNVQNMSKHVKRVLAYMAMLGFDNPLRTVWELFPYSFVFDWFIPIGDFLEQLRFDYFDSTVSVKSYCMSHRTMEPHTMKLVFKRPSTGATAEIGKVFINLYRRFRAIPNDNMFGIRYDNNFGTKQMLLSGALLTSIFGR